MFSFVRRLFGAECVATTTPSPGNLSESLTMTSATRSRVTVRSWIERDLNSAPSTTTRRIANHRMPNTPIADAPTAKAPIAVAATATPQKPRCFELNEVLHLSPPWRCKVRCNVHLRVPVLEPPGRNLRAARSAGLPRARPDGSSCSPRVSRRRAKRSSF
jgi:hypothetical protein